MGYIIVGSSSIVFHMNRPRPQNLQHLYHNLHTLILCLLVCSDCHCYLLYCSMSLYCACFGLLALGGYTVIMLQCLPLNVNNQPQ